MSTEPIDQLGLITVDFGQSLEAMIAAGKYGGVNPHFTAANFPVEGTGIKKFRTKLFPFGPRVSPIEVERLIRSESFEPVAGAPFTFWEPATHVHGLAFGATFPGRQCEYPIYCLGSSALLITRDFYMYLGSTRAKRYLNLDSRDGLWPDNLRYLGVQEVVNP
jgi:hypothetical protein